MQNGGIGVPAKFLLPAVVDHPIYWHAAVFGTIGTDGRWHNLHILEGNGPRRDGPKDDTYVFDDLKNERFKPATCDGVPVTVETAFKR